MAASPAQAPERMPPEGGLADQYAGLHLSGRLCGGIRDDIARRLPWYASDWVDGLNGGTKTVMAVLYMFFACLAPGVAEGSYISALTGGQTGVVEWLLTQGICGVIHAVISGQPLLILRPTGPITVFISQLYLITRPWGLPFHAVMAWVGIFVGTYMIIIAVTDACAAIRCCSRFTQDLFGCFVAVIFINLGVTNIVEKFTVTQDRYSAPHELIVTSVTLFVALHLASFSRGRFFNSRTRETIADFAAPLAVIVGTAVANLMTVKLEPLPVPASFQPTESGRGWLVDICPAEKCGLSALTGAVAAIPLVVLFFIDQNVTTLLTQHPDHKLVKGGGYHYNFLLTGIFNIVLPLFGCPYVTASLPHSPQFTRALARSKVEGLGTIHERKVVTDVCENRLAPLLVNVLILACLPVIGLLRYIPTAVVCDALFLFMGIDDLLTNPLFERMKLMITEHDLYPPMPFSPQEVPPKKMHVFTLVQVAYVAVLFGVSKSPISIAFPVFLASSIPVRMMLPKITGGFLTKDMVAILDYDDKKREPAVDSAMLQEEQQDDPAQPATSPSPEPFLYGKAASGPFQRGPA